MSVLFPRLLASPCSIELGIPNTKIQLMSATTYIYYIFIPLATKPAFRVLSPSTNSYKGNCSLNPFFSADLQHLPFHRESLISKRFTTPVLVVPEKKMRRNSLAAPFMGVITEGSPEAMSQKTIYSCRVLLANYSVSEWVHVFMYSFIHSYTQQLSVLNSTNYNATIQDLWI